MTLDSYQQWRAEDPASRAEISVVDGLLSGAAISLGDMAEDEFIAMMLGDASLNAAPDTITAGAVTDLRYRLAEIRAGLSDPEKKYAPILTVTEDGDFDMTAWATGFMEAVGPDLEMWSYLLADRREGGLFGLLGSHAAGSMGEAARAYLSGNEQAAGLNAVNERFWEFIPPLLDFLYEKKLQLGGDAGRAVRPAT